MHGSTLGASLADKRIKCARCACPTRNGEAPCSRLMRGV